VAFLGQAQHERGGEGLRDRSDPVRRRGHRRDPAFDIGESRHRNVARLTRLRRRDRDARHAAAALLTRDQRFERSGSDR